MAQHGRFPHEIKNIQVQYFVRLPQDCPPTENFWGETRVNQIFYLTVPQLITIFVKAEFFGKRLGDGTHQLEASVNLFSSKPMAKTTARATEFFGMVAN